MSLRATHGLFIDFAWVFFFLMVGKQAADEEEK